MIGIYKITSPSKRVYIGQSINIEKRFANYSKIYNCNNQTKLYNSFKKYGVENHSFEVVIECEESQLNELERYYQDLYNVIHPKHGLNCKLTKSSDKKVVFSEETKKLLSDINKKKKIILDLNTGVFYNSLTELCNLYKIKPIFLSERLRGRLKNKTQFIYV